MKNKTLGIILLVLDALCILLNGFCAVMNFSGANTGKGILYTSLVLIWIVCLILHYLTWLKKK